MQHKQNLKAMPPKIVGVCEKRIAARGRKPVKSSREVIEVSENEDDSEAGIASPVVKKQKRKKLLALLNQREEETLVKWLESNPIFFNKKLHLYKDTPKKEALWQEKALEMKKDVVILKTWYYSLRTRYGRLKKMASRPNCSKLTEREEWILKSFEFLKEHIVGKEKKIPREYLDRNNAIFKVETGRDSDIDQASSRPDLQNTAQRRITASKDDDTLLSSLDNQSRHFICLQQQLLDKQRPDVDRERSAFTEWLGSALNNLEHPVWRKCQREMTGVMWRFIEENDALKEKNSLRQQTAAFSQSCQTTSQDACNTCKQ